MEFPMLERDVYKGKNEILQSKELMFYAMNLRRKMHVNMKFG